MKRVLYFYPHKFSALTDGIHARIVTILLYFKSKGFLVDMINFENAEISTSYVLENNLVESIYYAKKTDDVEPTGLPDYLKRKIRSGYNRLLPKKTEPTLLPNWVNQSLINIFLKLTSEKKYDSVLITYSYWAEIIKHLNNSDFKGQKVIDTTDFLTLQQYYNNPNLSTSQIGNIFGSEIDKMQQFDDIIHISYDELLLFSNFITKARHHYIPQFFDKQPIGNPENYKYDILFIGSGNPFNVEGIHWFLEEVYPLLDKDFKIAIAGNVCNSIKIEASNILKLGFVEDAAQLFSDTRITICPLKKGSGMKIKVVESLLYGVPVISTLKGLDGFFNRNPTGGVLIANSPGAFAEHITHVLKDESYFKKQRLLAAEIFNNNFSFEHNFPNLDRVFNNV